VRPTTATAITRRQRREAGSAAWTGPVRRYDIVKEASIAVLVVAVLTVALAMLFSSPDDPPVTLQAWATAQPTGFAQIALSELDMTSNSATYGPPYNHASGSVQWLGPISIQRALGVHFPIDPAESFVLQPLGSLPPTAALSRALRAYGSAGAAQRAAWDHAYAAVLAHRSFSASVPDHPGTAAGPVPTLISSLTAMARSGALDAALVDHSSFYTTNYTKAILFIGDSWKAQHAKSYWGKIVTAQHLSGTQWGVMNETGSWPGQPWLWLYTMWYQVPPMSTSGNGDVLVLAIMTVCSLALLLVPFIPGLRDIPRWLPLHRLIWRDYYRRAAQASASGPPATGPPTGPPVGQPVGPPVGPPVVGPAATGPPASPLPGQS